MKSTFPADTMMKTIGYYYMVNYCPPSKVSEMKKAARAFRKALANSAEMKVPDYFKAALPEVCWRITAFHQATREPDQEVVKNLVKVGAKADSNEKGVVGFQDVMDELSGHPGRAKPDNRLHRNKGCRFCVAPCRYGYFSLVSDPVFKHLQAMLLAENKKPAGERDPVSVLWTYTIKHLTGVSDGEKVFIRADHLGNLSYCLLMLAMAKSRFAPPEKQLQAFQAMNQEVIRRSM